MPLPATLLRPFAAPTLSSAERVRVGIVIRLISITGLVAVATWAVIASLSYPGEWLRPIAAAAVGAVLVATWVVLRRGYFNRASWMIVGLILAIAFFGTVASGVGQGLLEGAFMLALIAAASLLGASQAIAVSVLGLIGLGSLLLLDSAGVLPEPILYTSAAGNLWARGMLLGVAAVLLAISARGTRDSFAVAESNDLALRRNNQELRASRDRYEALAANAHDLVAEVDEQGRFLYVNPAYGRMLGYDAAELVGKHALSLALEEDRPVSRRFDGLLKAPDRGPQRFRIAHKSGDARFIESTAAPYRTPGGEVRTTIISRDVSDRVEAEKQLLLLEQAIASVTGVEFFRTAVRSLATILRVRVAFICELKPGSQQRLRVRALWEDGAFREVPDYLSTGTPCEAVLRDGAAHHARGLRQLWRDHGAWPSDATVQSYSAVRLEDEAGNPLGHIGVMHDGPLDSPLPRQVILRILAARAAAEIQRERADADHRTLEERVLRTQKLESLGLLAGGIAHDFSNLLIGVLANAEDALLELSDDDPVRELIEDIAAASEGAADLVKQLLAYSGNGKHQVGPVDLSALVQETARMLRKPGSGGVVVEAELSARPVWIEADRVQLRQVLMNLITNAMQSVSGEGTVTLRTGLVSGEVDGAHTFVGELGEGKHAYLEVQDTGCGMDPNDLERVFDPFFTTRREGRGLGLSTVAGIVRGHGGALKATSEPGFGTTFRVLLPALESPPARLNAPQPELRRLMNLDDAGATHAPS